MVEFTGERVIPGQVSEDLWNEHIARYAFARRFASGKTILDAGCGAGYGSAELARAAGTVTGIDLAADAIAFARGSYSMAGLQFLVSSCTVMPFPPNTFDVIVAFEVIEHLADYRAFLDECARVLRHQGLFIVSSPNKRYYAESRAQTGPNPYHQHEFEPAEFASELNRAFTNVRLLLQNRVEAFAFHPATSYSPADACVAAANDEADNAHFLIGLCSFGPLPDARSFVFVPRVANLLSERERHIGKLEQELNQVRQWLADTKAERDNLIELFHRQKEELEEHNRWANQLSAELNLAGDRILALQSEVQEIRSGYEAKVYELEEENRAKTDWALRTGQALEAKCQELLECVRLLESAEITVKERTRWAQQVQAQQGELSAQLDLIRASRWVKLGRKLGLGPVLNRT